MRDKYQILRRYSVPMHTQHTLYVRLWYCEYYKKYEHSTLLKTYL